MSIPRVDPKDEAELLDYEIDMSNELRGRGGGDRDDRIAEVNWDLPADLKVEHSEHDDSTATVWISGGKAGEKYVISAEMTTVMKRTYRRSFQLQIRSK